MPGNTAISPQTINHFIGARNIVDRVKNALDAMWNSGNGAVFPHTLLLGPPGVGKTLIAEVICREMGVPLIETLGHGLDGPGKLNAALLQSEGGCLFIDEAHSLSGSVQVALLKVLQEGRIFLPTSTTGGKSSFLDLKPFCLLAATTDEWALSRPIVDRFRLILRFDYYSTEEMLLLVSRRAKAMNWELAPGVAEVIASRSKGTPRIGIRLLENCIRTAQAQNETVITPAILNRTCELEQLDSLGLDAIEQKYLRLLGEAGGSVRVNVIASFLGLPRQTLERAIEPFLIRERLIEKSEAGRVLTALGARHLEKSASEAE